MKKDPAKHRQPPIRLIFLKVLILLNAAVFLGLFTISLF